MKVELDSATWNGRIYFTIQPENSTERAVLIALDSMRVEREPAEAGSPVILITAYPTRRVRQKGRRRK